MISQACRWIPRMPFAMLKRDCHQHSLSQVRHADSLKVKDLKDLFEGNIKALRIPNFCPKGAMEKALAAFNERPIEDYVNAQGVGKFKDVGVAYFEAENKEGKDRYYATRLSSIEKVRSAFSPFLSPIDKVRLALDEQWPCGASLLNLGEGPMFAGLVRAIRKEILPHEDKLERDDPLALSKVCYVTQIAFNCYLSMPKQGGELELWDKSLDDKEYDRLRGKSYGIAKSLLPKPSLTLKPDEGEFIAFNGRNLHAVSANQDQRITRITVSGFILYQGKDKPIHLWS